MGVVVSRDLSRDHHMTRYKRSSFSHVFARGGGGAVDTVFQNGVRFSQSEESQNLVDYGEIQGQNELMM